jgi:uncharacterized OB-fold protein
MVDVQICGSCGTATFPPHVLCARCGAADWRPQPVAGGVLERVTVVRRSLGGAPADPPTVGRVRTDGGIPMIVRVQGDLAPGDAVALDVVDGAIVATPAGGAR